MISLHWRKLGERQTSVWTFQGGDTLVTSSSGLMMRFGKASWTKFMVTISGQRTFAPSWEQNSTWADARIPSVSPLAFAPRCRSKSLQFHLLNLSRATTETVFHYTLSLKRKSTRYSSTKTSKDWDWALGLGGDSVFRWVERFVRTHDIQLAPHQPDTLVGSRTASFALLTTPVSRSYCQARAHGAWAGKASVLHVVLVDRSWRIGQRIGFFFFFLTQCMNLSFFFQDVWEEWRYARAR